MADEAKAYELTVTVRDKAAGATREFELKSAQATPEEAASEVAGKLVYNYGGNLREVETER